MSHTCPHDSAYSRTRLQIYLAAACPSASLQAAGLALGEWPHSWRLLPQATAAHAANRQPGAPSPGPGCSSAPTVVAAGGSGTIHALKHLLKLFLPAAVAAGGRHTHEWTHGWRQQQPPTHSTLQAAATCLFHRRVPWQQGAPQLADGAPCQARVGAQPRRRRRPHLGGHAMAEQMGAHPAAGL